MALVGGGLGGLSSVGRPGGRVAGLFVEEQEMKLEVVEGETPAKQGGPCHACLASSPRHTRRGVP